MRHGGSLLLASTCMTRQCLPAFDSTSLPTQHCIARKRSTEASGSKTKGGTGKEAGSKGKSKGATKPHSPKGGRVSKRQGTRAAPPSPQTPTKAMVPKRAAGRGGSGSRRGGSRASSQRMARTGPRLTRRSGGRS